MLSLTQVINEGRISTYEIKKYVKSAMTNSTDYQQYIQYLKAILDGISEGIVENERYYKGKEEEDAQKFSMIVDDFMELFDKITK